MEDGRVSRDEDIVDYLLDELAPDDRRARGAAHAPRTTCFRAEVERHAAAGGRARGAARGGVGRPARCPRCRCCPRCRRSPLEPARPPASPCSPARRRRGGRRPRGRAWPSASLVRDAGRHPRRAPSIALAPLGEGRSRRVGRRRRMVSTTTSGCACDVSGLAPTGVRAVLRGVAARRPEPRDVAGLLPRARLGRRAA